MKKYLKTVTTIALFSISTFSQAAPFAAGEYTAQFYNDVKNNTPTGVRSICVKGDNTWYSGGSMSGGQLVVESSGKWFSKGNDIHFQSFPSVGGIVSTMSFNISRINATLLTGYFTAVTINNDIQNMTMILTYKSAVCPTYDPLTP